jgi:hypothetical protein
VTKLANLYSNDFDRVRINPTTGRLYVGGYDSGLAILEADGTFTPIPLTGPTRPDGRTTPRIHDFTFDRDGNLIISAQVVARRPT